jgi:hypothetical protein
MMGLTLLLLLLRVYAVGLSGGSAEYSEVALGEAASAVEAFKSNMGGTEILVRHGGCEGHCVAQGQG